MSLARYRRRSGRPQRRTAQGVTALALGVWLACAAPARALAFDPELVFPAAEGWLSLESAPDWILGLRPAPVSAPGAGATADPVAAPAGQAAAEQSTTESANPAATGAAQATAASALPDTQEAGAEPDVTVAGSDDGTGQGVVAIVGTGATLAGRSGPSGEAARDPVAGLAGVRYRVLDAGESAPAMPGHDGAYVYLRATARDLEGNPFGAEARFEDEDASHVRRLEWNSIPTALALALHQMPYLARWEVFIPSVRRPAGTAGAYRVFRSRPLIYDVQRMPPPEQVGSVDGADRPLP